MRVVENMGWALKAFYTRVSCHLELEEMKESKKKEKKRRCRRRSRETEKLTTKSGSFRSLKLFRRFSSVCRRNLNFCCFTMFFIWLMLLKNKFRSTCFLYKSEGTVSFMLLCDEHKFIPSFCIVFTFQIGFLLC